MVLTDYCNMDSPVDLRIYRADRIMYGSDFPNIPFAWDRELKWLRVAGPDDHGLKRLLNKNAAAFFDLNMSVNSDP